MRYPALVVALCAAPASALAQTGAPLLLQPWTRYGPADAETRTEARFEFSGGGLFFQNGDVEDTDDELDFHLYESRGRAKLTDQPGPGPALGFEYLHLDLSTDDPALPERLVDASAAAAFGTRLDDNWEAGAVVGIGYAGTRPYADGDAVYFLADLVLARQIDDRSKITFNLNYNGNRNLLPDVPLPAISYARRSEIEGLRYIVGFPFSTVIYTPDDHWELTATYSIPFSFQAKVGYNVAHNLQVFAAYDTFTRGFWLEDDPGDNDRLFFSQDRLELGARYAALDRLGVVVAAGWAFDQEFESGWDSRDTDNVRDVDDALYLRLALDFAW